MLQVIENQIVAIGLLGALSLAPVYAQSDERPVQGTEGTVIGERVTGQAELRTSPDRGDLEGVVLSVNPNGDDFVLRTNGTDVLVDARGGVKAWYQGRAYRIRDLERGDVVDVHLYSTSSRDYFRARSVDVLRSVSHDRYGNDRYRDDRYRDGRYRDHRYPRYSDRYDQGYRDDWRRRELAQRVSFDGRVVFVRRDLDLIRVRTQRGRNLNVDLSRLSNRSYRKLKVGDYLVVSGYLMNGSMVATDLDVRRVRGR
ncbi:MAG: hypothetical protein KY459_00550 [Acidobacteria bacterium]|nr:hypothetical protein [Acidobacteriota bacterium]